MIGSFGKITNTTQVQNCSTHSTQKQVDKLLFLQIQGCHLEGIPFEIVRDAPRFDFRGRIELRRRQRVTAANLAVELSTLQL